MTLERPTNGPPFLRMNSSRAPVAFPGHASLGCQVQLAVDLRRQLLQSTFITLPPGLKQLCDLVSEGLIHAKLFAGKGGQLPSTLPHYLEVSVL